jgi:hypothetical protein
MPSQPCLAPGWGCCPECSPVQQADTEAVSKLNAEIEKLKLQVGEQLIDPRQIALTRWADRHPDSFSSQAFLELKQEIESAGGNVQPIKVGPIAVQAAEQSDGPRFELVYGSRRTRACLELGLPVRAVVDENVDDQALYVQMQRENRGRVESVGLGAGRQLPQGSERGPVSQCPAAGRTDRPGPQQRGQGASCGRVAAGDRWRVPQPGRHSVPLGCRAGQGLPAGSGRGAVGCPLARRPVAEAGLPRRCSAA